MSVKCITLNSKKTSVQKDKTIVQNLQFGQNLIIERYLDRSLKF